MHTIQSHLSDEATMRAFVLAQRTIGKAEISAKARELAPNDPNRQFVLFAVGLKASRA